MFQPVTEECCHQRLETSCWHLGTTIIQLFCWQKFWAMHTKNNKHNTITCHSYDACNIMSTTIIKIKLGSDPRHMPSRLSHSAGYNKIHPPAPHVKGGLLCREFYYSIRFRSQNTQKTKNTQNTLQTMQKGMCWYQIPQVMGNPLCFWVSSDPLPYFSLLLALLFQRRK